MSRSAADRLRRLRLLLTVLFTTINAAGLIVLCALAIKLDAERGPQLLDAELHRVTSTVERLVQSYSDNSLDANYVNQDPVAKECPQFAMLPGAAGNFQPYYSKQTCVPMDNRLLAGLANDSATSGQLETGYLTGTNGRLVRVRVEPLRAPSGTFVGALVAVADAVPEQSDHNRFVVLVIGGCLGLIALLAVAGHLLSDRAIRPAATALEQQEILLAETAHDLRTPVAALRAAAETALRNPSESAELLPRAVRLSSQMGSIIDSLLTRARLAAGVATLDIQPVWLDQLVTVLVEDTPAEGASVTVTAAPSLVRVDPTLVQRAVGNLLGNALRYGRKPNEDAIVHITVANGRVTVADHGPGVAQAVVDDTLDRFHTGSGSTGLGLSIVRWIAQSHGGQLNVYNADEGGAIFELVLPTAGRGQGA